MTAIASTLTVMVREARPIHPPTIARVKRANEAALVAAAREGDLDAFAELVRRFEPRVRALLSRLLDDEREIEEATQDAFVQTWRSLDRFRGEAAFFTWLYRIAVNEALQRLRRRRVQVVELDEAEHSSSAAPGPGEAAAGAELRAFLHARIRQLPFDHRVALVLRDIEGLSNEEVASAIGISIAAAKSRIHRARMRLREEVEAWDDGGQANAS
jgi:RNA polymerase sigma-70 factor (ECF subfamily)